MSPLPDPKTELQIQAALEYLEQVLPQSACLKIVQLIDKLPEPVSALQRLEKFYSQLPWELGSKDTDGKFIYAALTVFANSRYLSNVIMNSPELLHWALVSKNIEMPIQHNDLRRDLGSFSAKYSDQDVAHRIAIFKHKYMLLIAMQDLLGFAPLADIARGLSILADVVIQGAMEYIYQQLVLRFGRPLCNTDDGQIMCEFVVLALGKLGASELNYSSDIDLMYLYSGSGKTTGPVTTTNQDFFLQLSTRLTNLMSTMTPEGFSYRVDLRLRPDGSAGELVVPLSSAARYYNKRARDWELQMLLKARPAAGNLRLGNHFLNLLTPRIYSTTTDFSQIERLAETRDRIQQNRKRSGQGVVDVKLDPGGIRDIEFLVQCLQRLYGGKDSFLRSGGTMHALHRLREKGYLGSSDCNALFMAYTLLRTIEHRLQMLDNRQTHELPKNEKGLLRLCRQLGLESESSPGQTLETKINNHYRQVSSIYDRVIHSQRPTKSMVVQRGMSSAHTNEPESEEEQKNRVKALDTDASWHRHLPHLERISPQLANSFRALKLRWGNRMLEHFLNNIVSMPEIIKLLDAKPKLVGYVGELLEYSPHFSGSLLRFSEDLKVLTAIEEQSREKNKGGNPAPLEMDNALKQTIKDGQDSKSAVSAMRRLFRKQMFLIQSRSICLSEDVFDTLVATSRLAEWILQVTHALALKEAVKQAGEELAISSAVRIIALGRLGTREFDLGSDADVVFVIPDSEAERRQLWAQAANRIVDIIASYTADGQMFSLDTRLRPLGRDGELVQTESQYLTYFSEKAETWEALSYMKSRTVAGDAEAGTEFLAKLQKILWRRFAKSDDLAPLLFDMRMRLESEQGKVQPLKSGEGGYYDIDFLLMYWRLLHAESFYESLNTPQRIEIIRETDPALGEQLDVLKAAATFLRALDHAVRIQKGTSSHAMPTALWQQEMIAGLVKRWSPYTNKSDHMDTLLAETCSAVREIFWSTFKQGK